MPGLDDVTVLIKSYLRPRCVARAIETIAREWPDVSEIIVLDDSPCVGLIPRDDRYRLIVTEPDVGLSEGRNRLVAAARTPVVALFDDDFVPGAEARIDLLAAVVRQGASELVAGAIQEAEGFWNGGWIFSIEGSVLHKEHAAYRSDCLLLGGETVDLYFVDQVNNALVADREFLLAVGWDPVLKLREHDDFALRSTRLGRIAYSPSSVIGHVPWDSSEYAAKRDDTAPFHDYFLSKWGLTRVEKDAEWSRHSSTIPRPRVRQ